MKDIIYTDIYDYCRWNKHKNVTGILNSHDMIDILYKDGIYIRFALQHNNCNMLNTLLDYYYDQHGLKGKPETYNIEQKQAKHKLFEILQDAVISEEMQKTLEEYGIYQNYDNSSTYSQEEIENLFDFHQLGNHDSSDNHLENLGVDLINTPPMRKSHSMDDIRNHSGKKSDTTHDNSGEKLLTLDQLKEFQLHFDNDHKDDIHSTGEISHHSDDLY